jgi:hypothetical protein
MLAPEHTTSINEGDRPMSTTSKTGLGALLTPDESALLLVDHG